MLGNDSVCLRSLLIFFLWHFPSECVGALGMCDTAQLPFMSSKTNQDSFPSSDWQQMDFKADRWVGDSEPNFRGYGDGDEVGWLRKCKPLLPTDSQLPFLPLAGTGVRSSHAICLKLSFQTLYWHYRYSKLPHKCCIYTATPTL